jgi:hypothetical protein
MYGGFGLRVVRGAAIIALEAWLDLVSGGEVGSFTNSEKRRIADRGADVC